MNRQAGPRGRGLAYTALASGSWWLLVPVALGLVLVLAPGLYVAAAVTHLRLRRHPDVMAAVVVAVPSAVAALGAVLVIHAVGGWGGYFAAWALLFVHQAVTAGTVGAVAVAGLAAGPAAGAAWWRADQWHRERQLVGGQGSRREREQVESARRAGRLRRDQDARHGQGRAKRGMGTGTPAGPYLGVVQSDRGLGWGRTGGRCVLPAGKAGHLVILGASGAGKSELVHRVAEWLIEHTGDQVAYLNAKEPVPGDEPSRRLIAAAAAQGKTGRVLVAGASPYDAFRGSEDEIRQRLLSAEVWSEPFYRHGSVVLLALALRVMRASGRPAEALPDVLRMLCDREAVTTRARGDALAAAVLEHVDDRSWAGAVQRYASNALTLARWTGPHAAGGWSFEDAQVLCWDLPTSTEPDAARMLLRWTLTDLFAYLTGPRRPKGMDGRPKPLTVILEELSALDDDPVIMRSVTNAMERARAAGVRFVVVAQGPSGLGDQRTQDAVLTNSTVISFRQISEAQRVSDLAGTLTRLEASGAYEGHGAHGWNKGSAREQEQYKVSPNEIRGLDTGDCFVVHRGRAALVTVALPAGAFGQPPPPAWLDGLRPVPALPLAPGPEQVKAGAPDGWGLR